MNKVGSDSFSATQIRVTFLCALIAMLDGFDTQIIAYVAPRIADDWGVARAGFGPVFAAGPVGLALGAFLLGPLADRIGRRAVIILSTSIFGLFALLTALAQTIDHLLMLRFLTGIGLGAAMPNIIALTGEFAPPRHRATLITLMFSGLPLGSTIGGFVANWLMARYDWPAVFVVGGVLRLLLVPILWRWLPESPALAASSPATVARGSVAGLFRQGRARLTLLLWLIYFTNLLAMYFLVNWLPTLLQQAGLSLDMAIISTAILNLGGAAGGVALGLLIDRLQPLRVLGWTYMVAMLAIAGLALAGTHPTLLLAAAALAGFTIVGAQTGCHVMTSLSYPAELRATGIGWALGIGRIGAIVGPLFGGALLAAGWAPRDMLLTAIAPTLVAFGAVRLLARRGRGV